MTDLDTWEQYYTGKNLVLLNNYLSTPLKQFKLQHLALVAQRVNPIALRTAKTLWSFGQSECNSVSHWPVDLVVLSLIQDAKLFLALFWRETMFSAINVIFQNLDLSKIWM